MASFGAFLRESQTQSVGQACGGCGEDDPLSRQQQLQQPYLSLPVSAANGSASTTSSSYSNSNSNTASGRWGIQPARACYELPALGLLLALLLNP